MGRHGQCALAVRPVAPPDAPVLLLVGSYRSEYASVSPFLRVLLQQQSDGPSPRHHREVALEPLTLDEGRELALRLIGQDDPAAVALAETVVRESRGSPYFVYELVEYLKEGGELGEGGSLSSDLSLDSVLGRRIRKLPDDAERLLEVLAVAGQPLRQAIACRAADLGAVGFSGLALLRAQHLVRGTGLGSLDEVETYHDRIRETVVNLLDADRRRELNQRLAAELEEAGGADPETLGVHFEGAGELAKAGHYYALAADEASEALAFDRAVNLYRRALELGPGDPAAVRRIRSRLGDALANVGRGIEAARAYQEAAVDADQLELIELQRRRSLSVPGERAHRRRAVGLRSDSRPGGAVAAAHAATGVHAAAAEPGAAARPRPAVPRALGGRGAGRNTRVDRHLPIGGGRHQYRRRDPRGRLPDPKPAAGAQGRRAPPDCAARWAGRPCTWPARDARPGGGPSDWLRRPAGWRTGSDILMPWAWPASPPEQPSS